MPTPAPLVIFGYGNPSRGDDALAPLLLGRIEARFGNSGHWEVVEDFQLQVEHALDLEGRALALFIDADASCEGPYRFAALAASRDASYSTHAISPSAVLQAFRDVHHADPPPAFVLGIRGDSFELGDQLSASAEASLEAAWAFLEELLAAPTAAEWHAKASGEEGRPGAVG